MKIIISAKHIKDGYGIYGDFLENSYTAYFARFGIVLVTVSNVTKNVRAFVDEIDPKGIILSGGNDIHPSLYGEVPLYDGDYSSDRDTLERELLSYTTEKGLPVLGVCRGMQFINVFFGGALIQNVGEITGSGVSHVATQHAVEINDEKAGQYFAKKTLCVNSYHKQAVNIKTLSAQLRPFAVAQPGGIVEALYHPGYPVAGIQWHPERKGGDKDAGERIVGAFINRQLFWL